MKNIILHNSKKMFYEVGYFKTDISNIIKKCGISTDSFYMHYDSKEDLLVKIIKKDLEIYTEEINSLVPKDGEGFLKMERFIRATLNALKKNPFFFAILFELEENDKTLSPSTREWLKYFWTETRRFIMKLLRSEKNLDENKRELLTSLVEGQLKVYIRYLLTENTDRGNSSKLLFLDLEKEVTRLSATVINTCRSLGTLLPGESIDSLTGVHTNKYFFKLFEEARSSGKPLRLIFLDLSTFSAAENFQEKISRDCIMADTVIFLKRYFRETDLVDRLCPFKFMILVMSENILTDTIESRMERLIIDLSNKHSLISTEDISWKLLHLNSFENFSQKLNNLKSIQQNYSKKSSG